MVVRRRNVRDCGGDVNTSEALLAHSSDGRTFVYVGQETFAVVPGDIVVLTTEDSEVLGQVLDCNDPAVLDDGGSGILLGPLDETGVPRPERRQPFRNARLSAPSARHLERLQEISGATLEVGTWRSAGHEVPGRLRAGAFNRHTFLCGQSGSGKTYALGAMLERLILNTALRVVVLDPNADFVSLGEPRADAPTEVADRLSATAVRVLGADTTDYEPLRLRFSTMSRRAQAALLELDPMRDREEYNLLIHRMDEMASSDLQQVIRKLLVGAPDERALGQRIENLGLDRWEVWAGELPSAAEIVSSGSRATVLDLSGFEDPHEPMAVSLDLVERLWAERTSRVPTLIVIDEAHNLCLADASGALQQTLVDRIVQIAAEGRKYGLWLVLSTQRPDKIHQQVVSQCDNLVLMRMNSPGDVAAVAHLFGFAPSAMLRTAPFFQQGEALFAGRFVATPSFFRMGARFTKEGGTDVAVPVAAP
jgi:hypothetical protein